jgi:SpoVK/Ycf46/Vps4 family AAA+-type ATPase
MQTSDTFVYSSLPRPQAQNEGILVIATTNHPEVIDDAILNRPSRFDVKYTFGLPDESLRREYINKWIHKTRFVNADMVSETSDNGVVEIPFENEEKTAAEVAKRTEGWSFAFLKEL